MTLIGKAWRGIQRFVQDIRIGADFPRYESEQRDVHASEANRRFDTSQLEREIDEIQRAAEAEGLAAFGPHIHVSESSSMRFALRSACFAAGSNCLLATTDGSSIESPRV